LKISLGLQLWKTEDVGDVDISRAWESSRENMKASATGSLVIMSLNSISHGLMISAQNY
jgi:hypothetical protein